MNFTRFSRKNEIFGRKFLRIFKALFTKSTLKQGSLTQFQHILTKNKKHGVAVLFCVRYQLGRPPQTPDQRTFCKKSFGISKTFTKIKWCFRCEVLWLTFLRKKGKLGRPPQTRTQRTFAKSPLESQKFSQK